MLFGLPHTRNPRLQLLKNVVLFKDLSMREIAILAPLVVITIALGVYPKPVLDVTTPAVAKLISDNKTALMLDHVHKVAELNKGVGR